MDEEGSTKTYYDDARNFWKYKKKRSGNASYVTSLLQNILAI